MILRIKDINQATICFEMYSNETLHMLLVLVMNSGRKIVFVVKFLPITGTDC